MKKLLRKRSLMYAAVFGLFLLGPLACLYAEDKAVGPTGTLVLHEGKEYEKNSVVVEAYLQNDILEVRVVARLYASRPNISDVYITGPKIGRVHYKTRETFYPTTEEEEACTVTKLDDGVIRFGGDKKQVKVPEGKATREAFKIKLPVDRIVTGKRYQLWVYIDNTTREEKISFKFDLEKLPGLLSASRQ